MGDQDRRGVFQRVIASNSRNPSKELELNHSAILYPAFIYLTYFSLTFPFCNIFFEKHNFKHMAKQHSTLWRYHPLFSNILNSG